MVGVYRIRNLINQKSYYGSSKNIHKRWVTHNKQLKNNTHDNQILQRAWNKYGEKNFVFEIIEECSENELFEIEQKYLDTNPEYNIGLKAGGGDNFSKNPNKKIIVENIKSGSKRWRDSLSDDEKKKIFSKPLEKNPNWRGGKSFIYCKCGKRIGYGHTYCKKCVPRSNENNPFFNKKHSEETKKKISQLRMGKYAGKQNKPIIIDDVEYRSYGEASKKLSICANTIRWRVLSKNPKYINYRFKEKIKKCYTYKEQFERLSKPQIGKQRVWNKPFIVDNIQYRTLNEASKQLNIHPMTIKGRLKSAKFKNYTYI
jgi:group I intron endonuclease